MQTVDKRLAKVTKDVKSGDKDTLKQKELLEKIKAMLEAGKPARELELDSEEKKYIKGFSLLTLKPLIYVVNIKNEDDKRKMNWGGEDFIFKY